MVQSQSASMEYIGNKRSLIDFVSENISRAIGPGKRDVCDIFSGTGAVSDALKLMGHSVTANDHLDLCFHMTSARLLNSGAPQFSLIPGSITRLAKTPYEGVLTYLNELPPSEGGFIHRNYSPYSKYKDGVERRYFSEINAIQIDTVRLELERLRPTLSEAEYSLLITDLLNAISSVSNVAGTYGCYLKNWKSRARMPLILRPSEFTGGSDGGHRVLSMDAHEAAKIINCSVVYADPPYTKRQYAAYYHVLETIVKNDSPKVSGKTGLRDWLPKSSEFCYKRRAPGALRALLSALSCEHFFMSYSSDGQISHADVLTILGAFGRVKVFERELKRYKSSSRPHKGPVVMERLYHVMMR